MRALGLGAAVLASILAGPVSADTESGPSFKRVKPANAASGSLINIQVEPVAPVERVLGHVPELPPLLPPPLPPAPGKRHAPVSPKTGWFWETLSPDIAAANETRLLAALAHVSAHPASRAPRYEQMSNLARRYGGEIQKATRGTRVSPALVLAVMSVESAGRPAAKSHAGAVGLMQLMPATARRFGVSDRTSPAESIRGGTEYLDILLEEFGRDPLLALAAYNAGEGAVRKSGGVPDYAETRAYVPKVIAAWGVARTLCSLPPDRATESCQFRDIQVARQQ